MTVETRHNWTTEEIQALLELPLMELLWQAQNVHRIANPGYNVQLASLLSVKTGGCEEDCAYCSQSIHNSSDVSALKHRCRWSQCCSGHGPRRRPVPIASAWDGPGGRSATALFEAMLAMVRGVRALGMEACVTAGMLSEQQADRLADAGLTAYNHNLDTSPEHYDRIISTRTYQERLETLQRVRKAGVTLCCGGIIGMGESLRDRASMLQVLATMNPHPESVPVNGVVAVEGTPLEGQAPFEPLELVRMVATARILMPQSRIRLSAGRDAMSREAQILCLQAGADSIFYGDTLLTTGNPDVEADRQLLADAGVQTNWQESQPAA